MGKAGGIVGLIAGIFAVIAALITLTVGGMGAAFNASGTNTVVGFGWGGLIASFLVIAFGAVAIFMPSVGAFGLLFLSLVGAVIGGTFVAVCLVLALLGGVLAALGAKSPVGKRLYWPWIGAPLGLVLGMVLAHQIAKPAAPEVAAAEPSVVEAAPEILPTTAPVQPAVILADAAKTEELPPAPALTAEPLKPADASSWPTAPGQRKCETSDEPLACETEDYEAADAALNAAYKQVMGRLSAEGKTRLRADQRAWIKQRDDDCEAQMGAARMVSCKTDRAITRTAEIERY